MIKQYAFKGDPEYRRCAVQWDGSEELAVEIARHIRPYEGAVYYHVPSHKLTIHTEYGMTHFRIGDWCVFTKFGNVIRMSDRQFKEYYEEVDNGQTN